jgi:hypothetical protein
MTEEPDQRVTCTECQRFKAGRCHQAQQAGLSSRPVAEVGSTFANLPQHCSGFKAKA